MNSSMCSSFINSTISGKKMKIFFNSIATVEINSNRLVPHENRGQIAVFFHQMSLRMFDMTLLFCQRTCIELRFCCFHSIGPTQNQWQFSMYDIV